MRSLWQWNESERIKCLEEHLAPSEHSTRGLSELSKIIHIKCLAQHLAHSVQSTLVNCCCHRHHHHHHHHFFTWPTPCLKWERERELETVLHHWKTMLSTMLIPPSSFLLWNLGQVASLLAVLVSPSEPRTPVVSIKSHTWHITPLEALVLEPRT